MRILSLYNEITKDKLLEANLRNLYTKSINETPKMAARGSQLQDQVRYFGLSEDGTLNFKVRSQTVPGRYHYAYIEAPDIIKFSNIVEEGGTFNEADLSRLLTMNGFRVLCNCPAFLYYSLKYIATQNNYDIEPETRAPKRNNTLLKGALDKHLIAVVYNLYNNKSMRQLIAKDINNYLRMLANMDYEDYQQLNHARQIKQQNRAVKWRNSPSDYMNNYFARQAKNHPFLDDHDIKHSLKLEINKYLKAHPDASTDEFLRSYFNMTQKAFADDMDLPENSITDYFNELGFDQKKEKYSNNQQDIQADDIPEETTNQEDQGLQSNILTKDSEQPKSNLTEANYAYADDVTNEELNSNKCKFVIYGPRGSQEIEFNNLKELFQYIDDCGGLKQFRDLRWFIQSNYKNGEFYYVRDSFAKGGWKWEDVNGYPVKHEYRAPRRPNLNESNFLNTLEPRIENDYSDLNTVEYYKDQIQKGNHRPILINRNKEILDGNHTMTAYQELGIEPPMVYQAERSQFYKAAIDHRGDALEAINQLINDGTATKLSESEQKTYLTPDEAHHQYQDYLTGHIDNVKKMVDLIIDTCTDNQFIQEEKETLRNIAEHHDESKYSDEEYFPYLRHFYPTRPEDEAKTEEFEQACRHHILCNKHHWDYWIDPNTLELRDIPEDDRVYKLYCVERVADWLSMAAQHNEDKLHWYENNKNSIKMPDWAFEFIDYIFSKVPDDFYLSADFKGTRGELDESKK